MEYIYVYNVLITYYMFGVLSNYFQLPMTLNMNVKSKLVSLLVKFVCERTKYAQIRKAAFDLFF